ncbi:exonuclease SbcC [Aneurinibacillus soli]|uniref:Nuclease SbcCD subunit C n=1 Tax=Aneurinibacillus soli TaxID=1500254 RepID=A0A0U5BK79_9BACL|nr:SMC family ATPase [Aneurinibacillus soli]PYE62190.1 exonuclease SbcC [Aneurinibacillus soli]BAU28622.1 Nuclease SbcCD subunit C [Aneurinibacillus soli]
MRPIHLKLAGINSFRDEQEVDFATLCEGGVFGIFGPTGSGKSSLLDAITLALYGKVERALGGTQGIMNQAEDQLSVAFTFELRSAEGAARYRVERRYKRTDDVKLRTATCRFIKIEEDGEKVLAGKERDVTQCVEDVLGLTVDDFTRAVVLPQGKFAEFLSLKGSERRQMLQRLFHLEQYGDGLNAKLKRRIAESRGKTAELAAEQQGLGDASSEAVQAAAERSKQAEVALVQAEEANTAADAAHEEGKRVWGQQAEYNEVKRRIVLHEADAERMDQLAEQLTRAEQAERVRPYYEERIRATRDAEVAQAEAKHARITLTEREVVCRQAEVEAQAARERQQAEEPGYMVRIEQLKQAEELEEEVIRLQTGMQKADAARIELQQQHVKAKELINSSEILRTKAITKQSNIQKQIQEKTVKHEKRQQIMQAVQEKYMLQTLQDQHTVAQQKHKDSEKRTAEAHGRAERVHSAWGDLQLRSREVLLDVQTLYNDIYSTHQDVRYIESLLMQLTSELRSAAVRETRRTLAIQLATELKEGEACPVCGSSHHLHPIQPATETRTVNTEKLIMELEDALLRARTVQHESHTFMYRLEQLAESLQETGEADSEMACARQSQNHTGMKLEPQADASANVEQLLVALTRTEEKLAQAKAQAETCEADGKQLASQRSRLKEQIVQAKTAYDVSVQQTAELQVKEQELHKQVEVSRLRWIERFGEWTPETVEPEAAQIAAWDAEVEQLRERLARSVPFIEEKEREIKAGQEKLTECDLELIRLETETAGMKANWDEKSNRLHQITGGVQAITQRQETEQELHHLRETVRIADERATEQQSSLREAEKRSSAAQQAEQLATARKAEAKQKWEAARLRTPFASEAEVAEAFTSEEKRIDWTQQLAAYRDTEKQLVNERHRLERLLDGRCMTEEEWKQLQEALQNTRAQVAEAAREQARAVRDLEDVEQRHTRWQTLEEERIRLQETLNRLNALQTVFRGNGFVEFIAEEQLMQVSQEASVRLGKLTRRRYAIEVDSSSGFVMRDDANGGVRRPVTTLSGGETFLTSLSLALALSAQIQLRGEYPLEFFFLDEGFGTLDQELLDTVITALEKLHTDRLSVGIISHVPELRARLPQRLIVTPAEPSGHGSTVHHEVL